MSDTAQKAAEATASVDKTAQKLADQAEVTAQNVADATEEAGAKAHAAIEQAGNKVGAAAGSMVDKAGDALAKAKTSLDKDGDGDIFDDLGEAAGNAVGKVRDGLAGVAGMIVDGAATVTGQGPESPRQRRRRHGRRRRHQTVCHRGCGESQGGLGRRGRQDRRVLRRPGQGRAERRRRERG